jgi:lysophospholipase L1-like esterase
MTPQKAGLRVDFMIQRRYLLQDGMADFKGATQCMTAKKFNFSGVPKQGFIQVADEEGRGLPIYDSTVGYGFIAETCSLPPREVHLPQLAADGTGVTICEAEFMTEAGFEADHYNRYGCAFRIAAEPGAYEVRVRTTCPAEEASIAVSAMHAERLLALQGAAWDAAQLVKVGTAPIVHEREWIFSYVNGREFIDIELEPKHPNVPVGLESIELLPLPENRRSEGELPVIYLLGDSTVKTYTFDEAPMSAWGQVVHRMFNRDKVKVINYSMGGRSFKNSYWEGRFNDILMTGRRGDYLFIQFGHNDESLDEYRRFGRGSTEESYERYIREVYLPAIRARGIHPVFVTAMSRAPGDAAEGHVYTCSFVNRKFPDIMRRMGQELNVPVLDLNEASIRYYNQIGVEAVTAIVMSIEAGETPGKTNDGTYANGHPANKVDGTHYKEALSKQFARLVVTELYKGAASGDTRIGEPAAWLTEEVKTAVTSEDWSAIFPEMAVDTTTGRGAYYRNQIEKLLQLGILDKDSSGCFRPEEHITVSAFSTALAKALDLDPELLPAYPEGLLTREIMGVLLDDAYHAKFAETPKFMTDYNGRTLLPGDPGYDPNLDTGVQGLTYYPLVPYENLLDTHLLSPEYAAKIKDAYELGLFRSEKGIARGKLANGLELEPFQIVTREKAAKALYFMWVLQQPVKGENHVLLHEQ